MSSRTLGLIAILCSPLLCIDFFVNGLIPDFSPYALSSVFNLLYTLGWMCGIAGLLQLRAAGNSKTGRAILITQLSLLGLSIIYNVYEIVNPGSGTFLYKTFDLFWPLSNFFMMATGVAVVIANTLQGWKKFIPLVVGLWLPVTFVVLPVMFGRNDLILILSSFYSAVAWFLLGLSVYKSPRLVAAETATVSLAYA
jgi:hypothetical protein